MLFCADAIRIYGSGLFGRWRTWLGFDWEFALVVSAAMAIWAATNDYLLIYTCWTPILRAAHFSGQSRQQTCGYSLLETPCDSIPGVHWTKVDISLQVKPMISSGRMGAD